ncbi:MAG TPA: transcriptional regulator [Pyrinomonadaceae bacterium]|nr:transcriptional regulator [Pyrinomonadaceae bacterium]
MARHNVLKKEPRARSSSRAAEDKLHKVSESAAEVSAPHQKFERLIHERSRLGIISALAVNESLTFNDLKRLIKTTDGNLSVHARKLEDAGYIACTKSFEGRTPKTEYKLTKTGRRALEQYLNHMEALIKTMRASG